MLRLTSLDALIAFLRYNKVRLPMFAFKYMPLFDNRKHWLQNGDAAKLLTKRLWVGQSRFHSLIDVGIAATVAAFFITPEIPFCEKCYRQAWLHVTDCSNVKFCIFNINKKGEKKERNNHFQLKLIEIEQF